MMAQKDEKPYFRFQGLDSCDNVRDDAPNLYW